jgi:hypothetical protein
MGYWDPPETEEPPECCGEIMEALNGGSCQCETCGKKIEPAPDIEPVDLDDYHSPENQCRECGKPTACVFCSTECANKQPCAHGNTPGDCDHCDHFADLAFDAARESR